MAAHTQEEKIENIALPNATSLRRKTYLSALTTSACLFGGMLAALSTAIAVSNLPMHVPEQTINLFAVGLLIGILFVSGALWGRTLARIFASTNQRRMISAGALSFAPALVLAGLMLATLERAIVERGQGPDLPVHQVFTLLFVPATFLVAATGGLALGLAERNLSLGLHLAAGGGLSAALAFLLIDLLMDGLGWRVGSPGAAERATMLTVMMAGNLAATFIGGGTIGFLLSRHFKKTRDQ